MVKAKKKVIKKKAPVKKAKPTKKPTPVKKIKPIGKVTHYYAHIKVAIVKFNTKVKAGAELYFKGATTDFKEASKSMQFDHKPVAAAMPKKQIGIKLKKRVREGDLVYKA
ncbi:MAG: translation elongation factor-like protein [Minisyncoccia bacterium]|jgi:hypothetical protein